MVVKLKKIVTILIFVKKQLILQLRDNKKDIVFPGTWGFISGELSPGESPKNGIIREMKEELSLLNIKNINLSHIYFDRKYENNIYYVFSVFLKSKPFIKLKEGLEYSFFSKIEFLKGYKYSKKLKKNCFLAQKNLMKKKYFRVY